MTQNDHEPRPQVRVSSRSGPVALLGYSVQAFEAAEALGLDSIAVVPPGFETGLEADGIRTVTWRFDKRNENSTDLFTQLQGMGARLAIPLYEECVEWAGALNSRFSGDPRAFNRSLLFRDKAMMKRKAQLSGIRVGVFEEVDSREAVQRFFQRVNDAELRIEGDDPVPGDELVLVGKQKNNTISIRSFSEFTNVLNNEFVSRLPPAIPRVVVR
ncbi:MAG: hypothetical protein H6682_16705 [Candidatus Eisenbacteria bacterium]|nr:hypothetical protein [Candidatus Eisenbacteria bacterium]